MSASSAESNPDPNIRHTPPTYARDQAAPLLTCLALLGFSLCAAALLVTGPAAFSGVPLISTLAGWLAALGHFEGYPYLSRDYGLWWSDGHYNLLRAFYILKGKTLYSDVPSSQFPGLHVLYAIALTLLGYRGARPGPELVPYIERTGQFVTGTIQILFFGLAARAAGLRPCTAAVAAFGIVWFLWERYGHWIPIIETVLCPVTTLLTVLLYRAFADRNPASRRIASLLLLSIACWAVVLGLTAAPTFVLWTAATGGALIADASRASRSCRLSASWRCFVALVAANLGLFILIVLINIDLHAMLFWAIQNPRRGFGINLKHNIGRVLTTWPRGAWHFGSPDIYDGAPGRSPARNFPLLGSPPCIFALLGVLFTLRPGYPSLARQAAYSGLVLLGVVLLRWRIPDDVFALKALPAAGVGFGLCLLLMERPEGPSPRRGDGARGVALAAAGMLFVLGIWTARVDFAPPVFISPRARALDEAAVCPFGTKPRWCHCALQAFYDPRTFLALDVEPCWGFSPDHPHVIQHDPRSRAQFWSAIRDPSVAFIVGPDAATSSSADVTERQYEEIIGIRRCVPLDGFFRVCVARGREEARSSQPASSPAGGASSPN